MRTCIKCNKKQAVDKSHYCDPCNTTIAYKKKQLSLADYRKYLDLHRKYGITRREYDTLFKKQNGKCAICGEIPNRIMVDHCHTTNKIRGLLCGRCNTGIGCFGDDIANLERAKTYLRKANR